MKVRKLLAIPAFAAMVTSLAACGGGGAGGPATVPTTAPTTAPKQPQANAKSTFSMRIPLKGGALRVPSMIGRKSGVKPMFVDGNTNGTVEVYFDGVKVLTYNLTDNSTQNGSTPIDGSGTFNWTATPGTVNNQPVVTLSGQYNTVPGTHTIGAVQLNGACVGPDPCIANNQGYVLAEGQTSQLLQPGTNNPPTALYLRGVMESVYICDPGCSGQNLTVDANGFYNLYVVVADENGTAINYQLESDGTTVVPFDNGSYSLTELNPQGNGGNGILSIDQTGPFSTPSEQHYSSGSTGYGINIKVQCAHTGTTTLVAQLGPNGGAPSSAINGFTPVAGTNYPTAGMVLGSVGSDIYYGNQLSLNCDANGTLTIQ